MTKGYLGPAAQSFLSGELHALGVSANTVGPEHIAPLADHIREHAARVMGAQKASALADALAQCDKRSAPSTAKAGGHKLASDAAQRLLETGRLRQAEKAYGELVAKHGDRESYIGLAKAQSALEDNEAALTTLREGAARFAKAGDRGNAVSLLAVAVGIAPLDLSAHRRLAAALANQGDLPGAVDEYARYVEAALLAGDSRRALLEISYGRETLGDLPGLIALVDRISSPGKQAAPADAPRIDGPQPAGRRSAHRVSSADAPIPHAPWVLAPKPTSSNGHVAPGNGHVAPAMPRPASAPAVAKATPAAAPTPPKPAPVAGKTDVAAPRTWSEASPTAIVQRGARTLTHVEQGDLNAAVDVLARAGVMKGVAKKAPPRPATDIEPLLKALTPTGSGLDAAAMAASRAALLTSARDVRATEAALDAARRLFALGMLHSASDVLLDLIGHGFSEREAQRLLIEIDCALGRRDVAKEKCNLLGHAYRLDGRTDVAEDVERLAKIL